MNDAQSTITGLNAQDCPGGGWNGMPSELKRATVADCLAHGVCGCIYGDAIQHIERLRAALLPCVGWLEYAYRNVDSVTATAVKAHLPEIRAMLNVEQKADGK